MTFKEYALQDANTLEATQTMLESRVVDRVPAERPGDPAAATCTRRPPTWVDDYQRKTAGV